MKIMLDAGHSYVTKGKGVPTMKEYEFNSAVVKYTRDLLISSYQNVEVHTILDDQRDTPLGERTNRANNLKVDVYVSVHSDAFNNEAANGETVYIYPTTPASTKALANAINDVLKAEQSISNRGIKTSDFHVLRETHMDAVLVEFGFMTNAKDLALLKSDTYRRTCARMLGTALAKRYNLQKKPAPVAPKPAAPIKGTVHRVIVNGTQVGAFANPNSIVNLVKQNIGKAAKIEIVRK